MRSSRRWVEIALNPCSPSFPTPSRRQERKKSMPDGSHLLFTCSTAVGQTSSREVSWSVSKVGKPPANARQHSGLHSSLGKRDERGGGRAPAAKVANDFWQSIYFFLIIRACICDVSNIFFSNLSSHRPRPMHFLFSFPRPAWIHRDRSSTVPI